MWLGWLTLTWEQFLLYDMVVRWVVVLCVMLISWGQGKRITRLENLLRFDLSVMERESHMQRGKRCGS